MERITASITVEGTIYWYYWGRMPGQLDDGLILSFRSRLNSRREVLAEIAAALKGNDISWLRPIGSPLGDWLLDLDGLKAHPKSPESLESIEWLWGNVRISPEYALTDKTGETSV